MCCSKYNSVPQLLPCACAGLLQLAGKLTVGRQQLASPAVGSRLIAVLTSPSYCSAQVTNHTLCPGLLHHAQQNSPFLSFSLLNSASIWPLCCLHPVCLSSAIVAKAGACCRCPCDNNVHNFMVKKRMCAVILMNSLSVVNGACMASQVLSLEVQSLWFCTPTQST